MFIEKFLESKKKRYAIGLIIIPIIIANVHSAVWPFYFVLYLPYVVEYLIVLFSDSDIYRKIKLKYYEVNLKKLKEKVENNRIKDDKIEKCKLKINVMTANIEEEKNRIKSADERREERRTNPYKIILKKNDNVKWLILIMVIVYLQDY